MKHIPVDNKLNEYIRSYRLEYVTENASRKIINAVRSVTVHVPYIQTQSLINELYDTTYRKEI